MSTFNPDERVVIIDNTTLETFTTCPRSAEYYFIRKRELAKSRSALTFGDAAHQALALRYMGTEPWAGEDLNFAQATILGELFKGIEQDPEDWRTLSNAINLMRKYNEHYPVEDFEVATINGQRVVEKSFSIPLGNVVVNNISFSVVWTGKIDLIIRDAGGRLCAFDHKTTSVMGPMFFNDYFLSSQMRGYCYTVWKLTGELPYGAYINALCMRKPTKSGTAIEFDRKLIHYSETSLLEWRKNTLYVVADFLHHAWQKYFPMYTKQCMGRYGQCQFFDVCSMPTTEQRELVLRSALFKDVSWDPTKKAEPLTIK